MSDIKLTDSEAALVADGQLIDAAKSIIARTGVSALSAKRAIDSHRGAKPAAAQAQCPNCDEWRRKAEDAEAKLADLTGGVTLREAIIRERDTLAVQVGEMRGALELAPRDHAESCTNAARHPDPDNCRCWQGKRRAALALTPTRAEKVAEARKAVCQKARLHIAEQMRRGGLTAAEWNLVDALTALDAAEGGGE